MAFNPRTINKELDFANLAKHNDNYADIKTELDAHDSSINAHIAAQTAHGSTAAATPGAIMQRDSEGRAKVAAPAAADDIARKAEVDAVQEALDGHIGDVDVHLSESDRDKLDGIEPGAEPNQNAFAQVNNVAATSESDTLTIVGGTGIAVTTNPTTKTVTLTATGDATPGPHGPSHDPDGSDPIPALSALIDDFNALTAADIGAETPAGAQAKVDALAGVGNTKTVKQLDDEVTTHLADVVPDTVPHLGTTTNSGDAYSITTTKTIGVNRKFTVKFNASSTSAPTLKINGDTAYPIKKPNGNAAKVYASVYTLFWDGTNFILLGEGGEYGTATAADVRSSKTIGTENGVVQGTLDLTKLLPENIKSGITIAGVTGTAMTIRNKENGTLENNGTLAAYMSTFKRISVSFRPNLIILYHQTQGINENPLSAYANRWFIAGTPNLADNRQIWFDNNVGVYNGFGSHWVGTNGAQPEDISQQTTVELTLARDAIQSSYFDVTCTNKNNNVQQIGKIYWWAYQI